MAASQQDIEYLIRARDEATRIIKQINSTLGKTGNEVESLSKRFDRAARSAREASTLMAGAFAQRGTWNATVGAFTKIESQFINVAKTAGLSNDALEELKGATRDLSREMTSIPIDKLQSVQTLVGQMGSSSVSDINALTKTIVMLQSANESLNTDEGAATFARFAKLSKTAVKDYEALGSALTQLGNDAAVTEDQILNNARLIKQSTAQYRMSGQEILGLATATAEAGLRAELTGSVIGRVMSALDVAAATNSTGFKRLAEISGKTREEWQKLIAENPTEALIQFAGAVRQLGADGENIDTAAFVDLMQKMGLYAEENRRVIGTMAANFGDLRKFVDTSNQAFKQNNALSQEYQRRADAFQTSLTNLSNQFQLLGESIGEAAKPVLSKVIDGMAAAFAVLAETIRNLPPGFKEITALAIILAPALLSVGAAIGLIANAVKLLGLGTLITGLTGAGAAGATGAAGLTAFAAAALKLFGVIGAGVLVVSYFSDEIASLGEVLTSLAPQGLQDFFAMDPTTGTIQWGKNAGKNFFTGMTDYVRNANGEWVKFEDSIQERARKANIGFDPKTFVDGMDKALEEIRKAPQTAPKISFELDDVSATAIKNLDTYTDQLLELKKVEEAIAQLREKMAEGREVRIKGETVTEEDIRRYEKLMEYQRIMADPATAKLYSLQQETIAANATTGAMKDQLEIQDAIREIEEQRGSINKELTDQIIAQIQELQAARKAAFMTDELRNADKALELARARTDTARSQVEIEQQIADIKREQNITDEASLGLLRQKLEQAAAIARQNALEDQLDPIGAANRGYQEQLATLKSMNLEAGRFAQLKAQLDWNTREERDPVGERVRQMREEVELLRMGSRERGVESQTIQELNNMRSQGVTISKELTAAVREYYTAMRDAEAADQNGLAAWAENVGDAMENFHKLTEDITEALSGAISDGLINLVQGKKGALQQFAHSIGRMMVEYSVKQFMADGIKMFNLGNGAKNAALDRAAAAADKIDAAKALTSTAQMNVQAGVVNVNGASLPGMDQIGDMTKAVEQSTGKMGEVAGTIANGSQTFGIGPTEKITRQALAPIEDATKGLDTSAWNLRTSLDEAGKSAGAVKDSFVDLGNGIKMTPDAFDYKQALTAAEAARVTPQTGLRGGLGLEGATELLKPNASQATNFAKNLTLSPQEIIDLKKTVATEWVQSAGDTQGKGIIDTILNRKASGKWGDSIEDVVNARKQFSDINGPPAWKHGRNSVDDLPMSRIDPRTNKLVDDWLAQRAGGAPSSIGDNLNYANPNFSSANNLGWINRLDGPTLGRGNAIHKHGTVPELQKYRPGEFGVQLPGQTPAGVDMMPTGSITSPTQYLGATGMNPLGAGGTMPQITQVADQFKTAMNPAITNVAQTMPQAFTQPIADVGMNFSETFSQAGSAFQNLAPQLQNVGQNLTSIVPQVGSFGSSMTSLIGPLAQAPAMTGQFSQSLMQMMQQMAMQNMGGGLFGMLFHGGGEVGGGGTGKFVSASAFSTAKRYHSGLKNDEFTAILQRGERVLTRKQNRDSTAMLDQLLQERENGILSPRENRQAETAMAGGNRYSQTFNITTPDANSFRKSQGQINADASVQMRRYGGRNT